MPVDGGRWPLWGNDGRELCYVGSQGMMRVPVSTEPSLEFGRAEVLFDTTPYNLGSSDWDLRAFDFDRANSRFLMRKPITPAPAFSDVMVVQNWFEELRRLVPTE